MVADPAEVRRRLVELHRELLEAQRIESERFTGRMSSSELLQAAADDLRFSWLRTLSELVAAFDVARRSDEPDSSAELVARTRQLLSPPDPQTAFGARYLRALQDHPSVVLAHRDLTSIL